MISLLFVKGEKATTLQVALLGFSRVFMGHLILWNTGLNVGLINYLLDILYLGSFFVILIPQISELASALPFTGGLYGYIRALMGPMFGFVVGINEIFVNVAYLSTMNLYFCVAIVECFHLSTSYEPIFWIAIQLVLLGIISCNRRHFWQIFTITFLVALGMVVLYVFASSTVMMVVFAIAILTVSAGQFPGAENLHTADFPLSFGFARGLGIPIEVAHLFTAYGLAAAMLGVQFINCRIIASMADSGLLPTLFSSGDETYLDGSNDHVQIQQQHQEHHHQLERNDSCHSLNINGEHDSGSGIDFLTATEAKALAQYQHPPLFKQALLSSILSIIGSAVIFFTYKDPLYLVIVIVAGSCTVYGGVMMSYMRFITDFNSIKRSFRSPFGKYGAIYGVIHNHVMLVAFLFLQRKAVYELAVIVGTNILIVFVYFVSGVNKTQKFSAEEQRVLFAAYVVNANKSRQKQQRTRQQQQAASSKNSHHHGSLLQLSRQHSQAKLQSKQPVKKYHQEAVVPVNNDEDNHYLDDLERQVMSEDVGSDEEGSMNLRNVVNNTTKNKPASAAAERSPLAPALSNSSLVTDPTCGFANSGSSNNIPSQQQLQPQVFDSSYHTSSRWQQSSNGSQKPQLRLQQQFQQPRTSLRMSMARQMNEVAEELFTTRPSAALLEQTGFVLKDDEDHERNCAAGRGM